MDKVDAVLATWRHFNYLAVATETEHFSYKVCEWANT